MNRYDDPHWYEENYSEHASSATQNNKTQSLQPANDASQHHRLLPTSQDNPSEHNQISQPLFLERHTRLRHILEQFLLIAPFVIIAFWVGWFSHVFFSTSFNQGNQSKADSQLIEDAWRTIDQHYVDRKDADYKKMAYAAINAMVQTLGDTGHSRFMTPQEAQSETQQLNGTLTGIGIYIRQDPHTKQFIINATIPGSPAEKAGVKHGDRIVAINSIRLQSQDVNAATNLIKGKIGTSVTLTIERPGDAQPRNVTVTRSEIQVPNVLMHYISESHIADIQIAQFASGVTNQLRDAVNQAKNRGATKLILDLRDDPGGYLQEAIDTTSLFVKDGNVLLEQNSSGKRTPVTVQGNPLDTSLQIIVLVNRNTASAAEIVSGALKDNHRAVLLGEKTFGTGTVLEPFPLSDGSTLYLGTQEWLTPNGHFIRQDPRSPGSGGINPTITVPQGSNSAILTPNDENQQHLTEQQILDSGDAQLSAAIRYLMQ